MAIKTAYEHSGNISDSAGTDGKSHESGNEWEVGQTFTVGSVGTNEKNVFTGVQFYIKKVGSPTGNVKLSLRSVDSGTSAPNAEILAEGDDFDVSTLTTSFVWTEFTVNAPATLAASTEYAVTLSVPDGTHTATDYIEIASESGGDSYAGGSFAKKDSDTMPTKWTVGTRDTWFATFGVKWEGTLCEYENVIAKTGKDVATELTTGGKIDLINKFVLQAESTLNVKTKFNWIDNFAALNADVKEVLTDVVSSMAAIHAIAYDMDAYGTNDRVIAEDMINLQTDHSILLMNMLSDKNKESFMSGA